MSIDPTKFEAQGKPTADQARMVYDNLSHQTVDTLHTALTGRGFSIGRATVARWIKSGFTTKVKPGPDLKMNTGDVKGIPPAVREVIEAEAVIGGPMSSKEFSDIQRDLDELKRLDMPALKAMLEQERLMYNIMMLRQAQRKSDKLVLIPRESAAFIVAMTDAAESVPGLPVGGKLPGDDAKVIEASVNPPNPVADAISLFKKRQGVAA